MTRLLRFVEASIHAPHKVGAQFRRLDCWHVAGIDNQTFLLKLFDGFVDIYTLTFVTLPVEIDTPFHRQLPQVSIFIELLLNRIVLSVRAVQL